MDPALIGKPLYWDLENHVAAILQMIRADELQIALKMLDDVPAWYRTNYPKELSDIKRKLFMNTYDQIEYATDDDEASCPREMGEQQWTSAYCFPRGEIITQEVQKLNSAGKAPWIFDLGCSHGNMPLGLYKLGLVFTYLGKAMNLRASEKIKEWLGPIYWREKPNDYQEKWLVCTEVIEHCFAPEEIVHSANKLGHAFDQIFLSVPLGCLYGGLHNWDSRRLGHVRGWTAEEFAAFAKQSFPGYKWTQYISHSQVLHGVKA